MRDLIAELPALSVAIPAISIALPVLAVLLLSAIFHWIFVPSDDAEETPDHDIDAANPDNDATNHKKTPADDRLPAAAFNRQNLADNSADPSYTSTDDGLLELRHRRRYSNPESQTARRRSDLDHSRPEATPDADRRALTARRLSPTDSKLKIDRPRTTQAQNPGRSTPPPPTTPTGNLQHERNSAPGTDNLQATRPTNSFSAQQKPPRDQAESKDTEQNPFYTEPENESATEWLSSRTESSSKTNQADDLQDYLRKSRLKSATVTQANAPTTDNTAPPGSSVSSSPAASTNDNQAGATGPLIPDSLNLHQDAARQARSRSRGPALESSSTQTSLSGNASSPTASPLVDSPHAAQPNTENQNAHNSTSTDSTTPELHDSSTKEQQDALNKPVDAASFSANNSTPTGDKVDGSIVTTRSDNVSTGSTTTTPNTEKRNTDSSTSADATARELNDSSAKEYQNFLNKPADATSSSANNLTPTGDKVDSSLATTRSDNVTTSSTTATPNTEKRNTDSSTSADATARELNDSSAKEYQNFLNKPADAASSSANNSTPTGDKVDSSLATTRSDNVTTSSTTATPNTENRHAHSSTNTDSATPGLNEGSAKEHQNVLNKPTDAASPSGKNSTLTGARADGSSATTRPDNIDSGAITAPSTTSTENNNATTPTSTGKNTNDSSGNTTHDKVSTEAATADQNTQNHDKSSFDKPATQSDDQKTDAKTSPDNTESKFDTTKQTTSADTVSNPEHQHRSNQLKSNQPPQLQSNLHGNVNNPRTNQNQSTSNHRNASANGPSRTPERPKYQTAAKAKYLPSSIEAQLKVKTPVTTKNKGHDNNSVTGTTTTNDNVDPKLLAEKDRLIEELEAKLKAFQQQADSLKQNDQKSYRPVSESIAARAAPSNGQQAKLESSKPDTVQNKTVALNNTGAITGSNTPATQNSTSNSDLLASTQPQGENKANAPAQLLSSVSMTATGAQEVEFKQRYEKAAEKLAMNDQKIQKLQSTVNRLQASGLVELQNAPVVPHGRKTLLSKVRVMAPAS